MEKLSEGLRTALSQAMMEELQKLLAERAEESQITEHALKKAMEKVIQDISELEKSRKTDDEEWQREKERLEAGVKATRCNEKEVIRLDLELLGHEIRMMEEKAESERKKILALEKECQRVHSLLEKEKDFDQMMVKDPERLKAESDNWIRWTQERVNSTLSMVLTTASAKQRWLTDLKNRRQKCILVSNGLAREASNTSKPCFSDGLQSQKVEQLMIRTQMLQEKYDRKFKKEMERAMAKATEQQEKIRAAKLKERRQLEEKTRKELERIHKAELKERKKREKKEKKEAEKLEKMRQKEERVATRQSRFLFWRRSSTAN